MRARASKYKLGARAVKYKLGAKGGKYKLGARAGKYKLEARARAGVKQRARGRETQRPALPSSYLHQY